MKYSDLIEKYPVAPRMMRTPLAEHYVGAAQMLVLMEQAKWVKPSTTGNRMKLWDRDLLDKCCDRLTAGEYPKPK